MEEGGNRSTRLGDLLEDWEAQGWSISESDRQEIQEHLHEPKSIAIRLVTGFGAFLTALLLMISITIFGGFNSTAAILTLGILSTVVYMLYSAAPLVNREIERPMQGDFLAPFMLTVGIMGQILITAGMLGESQDWTLIYTGLAVEGILLAISSDSLQKVISSVLILLCLWGAIHLSQSFVLIHPLLGVTAVGMAYLWIHEARLLSKYPSLAQVLQPVGLGLPLGMGLLLILTVNRELYSEFIDQWAISTVCIGVALLYAVYRVMHYYKAVRWFWLVAIGLLAVLIPTIPAPGIAFSLLVIALGFFRAHKVLLTLGLVSLVAFTIAFYYNMHLSLLWKSLALFLAGLALLGLRWGIQRMFSSES